jgi:hypothetical protein
MLSLGEVSLWSLAKLSYTVHEQLIAMLSANIFARLPLATTRFRLIESGEPMSKSLGRCRSSPDQGSDSCPMGACRLIWCYLALRIRQELLCFLCPCLLLREASVRRLRATSRPRVQQRSRGLGRRRLGLILRQKAETKRLGSRFRCLRVAREVVVAR